MTATVTASSVDSDLAEEVGKYYADPLGWVRFAYPWGEKGTPLERKTGPDENQIEFLNAVGEEVKARKFDGDTPVMPIRMAETSGHGTGKSAMGAWIAGWILSTRPDSIGTVTAGTALQLEERTWAAISYWMDLCITKHWFDVMARAIYSKLRPNSWKLICQSCKPENAGGFAGQHAAGSTSWYLFDEASTVPESIWPVAFGGMTDGEPHFYAWGQPERNTGKFYEITEGRERDRWNHRRVDSRSSRFTNKPLIEEYIRDYGLDSDFCRVRVMGLSPLADELQYIDKARIEAAGLRSVYSLEDEPLIAGFDVSGGGRAWNVIRFRKGLDASSIPPIRIAGEQNREVLITRCAALLQERKIAMLFIDAAFGAPIAERLKSLGYSNVTEVNFGGPSPDEHQANLRAYMYAQCKDWLLRGSIDPKDERLSIDLAAPGYHINRTGKLVLESKEEMVKRLGRSPDDSDALCLTFAQPVAPKRVASAPRRQGSESSWMG